MCGSCIGTVILGDMNVHHARWLRFSAATSPEGVALCDWCRRHGFEERVRSPTRGDHLLDLVLTDLADYVSANVSSVIADHGVITVLLATPLVRLTVSERVGWVFSRAQW